MHQNCTAWNVSLQGKIFHLSKYPNERFYRFFVILLICRMYEEDDPDFCNHAQARICRNLKYNLEQLRIRSDRDTYLTMIERILVGPSNIRATEADLLLGINSDLYNKFRSKRRDIIESGERPSWKEAEAQGYVEFIGGEKHSPLSPR